MTWQAPFITSAMNDGPQHAATPTPKGEALMNTPKALAELAQKPAGEIVTTLAKGTVQLVKDTGQAAFDVGYYGAAAVIEGGDENWKKLGNATTDLVLNTADVVTLAAGGAGL
jgi:hypothetical protein